MEKPRWSQPLFPRYICFCLCFCLYAHTPRNKQETQRRVKTREPQHPLHTNKKTKGNDLRKEQNKSIWKSSCPTVAAVSPTGVGRTQCDLRSVAETTAMRNFGTTGQGPDDQRPRKQILTFLEKQLLLRTPIPTDPNRILENTNVPR